MMSTLNNAIKSFKEKDFRTALELFEKSATIYGPKMVEANIKLCKKALASDVLSQSNTDPKSQTEINEYFDEIYLVNLKHEVKRRLSAALHLKKNGIKFTLHEATNGYEGEPLQTYRKYQQRALGELKRYPQFKAAEIKRGKPFIESAGAIGYIYTYLSILRDAKQKKHKRILILEDDILLHNNFSVKFTEFIRSIPKDWKILQLGASQYNWRSVNEDKADISGFYHPRQLDTCGSFAIALDHTIFDELLEAESSFESPFDHLAIGELYEKHLGKCFVCYPNIAMPDVADSSIRAPRKQKDHAVKMRWRIENFEYPLQKPTIAVFIEDPYSIKYLENFDNWSQQPFQLRIYLNTIDGPRPVHQGAIFEKPNYTSINQENIIAIPTVDFAAKIHPKKALTEDDVNKFLDSKLLNINNDSNLQGIEFKAINAEKGKVSIIIPTYKRPINLGKAIDSVISQIFSNKEIIVISDNTHDSEYATETRQIIEDKRRLNPEVSIKFIQHTYNRNGAAARNTGISNSTGEFICFLDDDDIYLPKRLSETVSKIAVAPPEVGGVYCGFLGWNSPKNDESRYKTGDLSLELLILDYRSHYVHTNTVTYKRTALLAINGFDETYKRHQDIELNLRFFDRYKIDAVKFSGVRLNPEPSNVSNKIFNSELIELKQKFLHNFKKHVDKFPSEIKSEIYSKHWQEALRYSPDKKIVTEYLKSKIDNGHLQMYIELSDAEVVR